MTIQVPEPFFYTEKIFFRSQLNAGIFFTLDENQVVRERSDGNSKELRLIFQLQVNSNHESLSLKSGRESELQRGTSISRQSFSTSGQEASSI